MDHPNPSTTSLSLQKAGTNSDAPKIFAYNSHIEFMNDFLSFRQSMSGRSSTNVWTVRNWARRLGVASSTTVFNILKGKKLPSATLTAKIAHSMNLLPLEHEYFSTLIEIQRQKDSSDTIQIVLMRKLRALETIAKTERLNSRQFQYTCLPQHHVLRALTTLRDFSEDPTWIRDRIVFNMSDNEIRCTFQDLIYAGLLARNRNGRLIPTAAFHETHSTNLDERIFHYLNESIESARHSIKNAPISERTISNNIFSVRFSRVEEMKAFIHTFREDFLGNFGGTDEMSDSVYQLNIQLFPAARPAAQKDKSSES